MVHVLWKGIIMKYLKYLILLLIGLCLHPLEVTADNQAAFSVNAEQSPYQVDKQQTYFDLKAPVNQKTDLVIHVTNNSDKNLDIKGEIAQATTNINGVVEYSKTTNKLTKNVPFDITKIAQFEKAKQTIAPHQTADFIIHVTTPTDDYAGLVAGGISFHDVTKDDEDDKNSGMFKNKFAYAIALLLHGKKEIQANNLTLTKAKAGQANGWNVVYATIENLSSNYLGGVKIKAKVVDQNQKEVLNVKKENLQISPDSIFQLPIYYNGKTMKAGKYQVQLKITSKGKTWNLKKDFTITAKKATDLNKTDISPKPKPDYTKWLVIGLSVIVIILILVIVLLLKNKKER